MMRSEYLKQMTPEARAAFNAYRREYYRKNRERAYLYQMRYWEKKAQQMRESEAGQLDT